MLLLVSLGLLALVLIVQYRRRDPEPILGVYKQPGKWYFLKYFIFWCILFFRKLSNKKSNTSGRNHEQVDDKLIKSMEVAQRLSDHPKAFDAVFFIATNKEGFYLIIGAERRNHGIINGLFYLLTPDRGLLCNRKIPDTILFGAKKDEFGAEGILLTPVDAMRKWSVKYHGEMRLESDPEQVMNVKLDAEFDSDLPYFNFDTDLHPSAMCRAFAKEDWTKEYFNNLKSAHQTHYEQMGNMHGSVEIDGTVHQLELQAFRDHSYGHKRDWDLMHRYAFHMLFLENGMRASIGVICQPCTCSLLESGYVYTPNGDLHPLEWCDFKLYQHGEGGTPPVDYAFQFKAGGTVYTVKAKEINQSIHFKGWKWEARMVERFLTYEVNGVLGKGVSEFHYHSSKGRSKSIARDDPGWFQDVIQKS